jgi:hypothetical protein
LFNNPIDYVTQRFFQHSAATFANRCQFHGRPFASTCVSRFPYQERARQHHEVDVPCFPGLFRFWRTLFENAIENYGNQFPKPNKSTLDSNLNDDASNDFALVIRKILLLPPLFTQLPCGCILGGQLNSDNIKTK